MTKQPPVIFDFTPVPPTYRRSVMRLFQQYRLAIVPISKNSLKFVFAHELSYADLMYFKLIRDNVRKMGLGIITPSPQKETPLTYKPVVYPDKTDTLDLDLTDVPLSLREKVLLVFKKENIQLIPLSLASSEETFLFRIHPDSLSAFNQSEKLHDFMRKNEIHYIKPSPDIPAPKEELPAQVILERKAKKQAVLEAKAAYLFQKKLEILKPTSLRKFKNMASASVASFVLLSALNPEPVSRIVDEVMHGQWDRIANTVISGMNDLELSVWEGIRNPKKAVQNISDQVQNGFQFVGHPVQTGKNWIINIGSVGFNAVASLTDSLWGVRSWEGREKIWTHGSLSYQTYVHDPVGYLNNAFVSVDKKTGLKGNDTIFSIIDDGRIEAARDFIEKGLLYHDSYQGNYGLTPLRYAIEKRQPKIAELIWDNKKNIPFCLEGQDGKTPLMRAIELNALDENEKLEGVIQEENYSQEFVQKYKDMQALILKMACSSRVNLNVKCPNGETLAALAVRCGNSDLIPILVKRGVDFSLKANKQSLIALAGNNPRMLQNLFQMNTECWCLELNQNGNPALYEALLYSDQAPGKNDKAITVFLEHLTPQERKELSMAPFYGYYIEQWAKRNEKLAVGLFPAEKKKNDLTVYDFYPIKHKILKNTNLLKDFLNIKDPLDVNHLLLQKEKE